MRPSFTALAIVCFGVTLTSAAQSNSDFNCTSTHAGNGTPTVVTTKLGDTPALIRIPSKISQSPIVLWHGFGPPASEQALMEVLPLDEVPAVKVYLGLPMFGSRALPGGMSELARRQQQDLATLVFEPAVMNAAKELPAIVRALEEHDCLKRGERIGLFGFSAGGAAVWFALAERVVPIDVAVTLNASTGLSASVKAYERATKGSYTWTEATRRLAQRSDAAGRAKEIVTGNPPPALLIIHGKDDAMMTPEIASSLHRTLLPLYQAADSSQRLQLTIVPGMAHAWTSTQDVQALRSSIAAWFHTYLSATGTPG
jgi:predicted esterase